MDKVWDDLGCDNRRLVNERISAYYRHPIWLLNGLFVESHQLSLEHRSSISKWIVQSGVNSMLDYGGGFCSLSRMVSDMNENIAIDVLEPFPAAVSLKIVALYPQIQFENVIKKNYDCIVALDVLEHVPDPLRLLAEMLHGLRLGGKLLIGNCFHPVIKCHLPKTFHFNNSFCKIAEKMNLDFQETIENSHVQIYQKNSSAPLLWYKVRLEELRSKISYKLRNTLSFIR